jgi:homoserine dehydrogenase
VRERGHERRTLRVGVAGLGTVGGGTLRLLRANADLIEARAGRPVAVTAVSAKDPGKRREGLDLDGLRWHGDPRALAETPRSTSSAS